MLLFAGAYPGNCGVAPCLRGAPISPARSPTWVPGSEPAPAALSRRFWPAAAGAFVAGTAAGADAAERRSQAPGGGGGCQLRGLRLRRAAAADGGAGDRGAAPSPDVLAPAARSLLHPSSQLDQNHTRTTSPICSQC